MRISDWSSDVCSSDLLLVPTLGDLMKDRDPRAQVVSVSGKDRSAIMMGGHKADELMWLTPTGLTSYRGRALSPVAQQASAAIAAAIAAPQPGLTIPAACPAHHIHIPQTGRPPLTQRCFPYS